MTRQMYVVARCDSCGVVGDLNQFDMDRLFDVSGFMRKPRMLDLCTDQVEGGRNCSQQFEDAVRPWIDRAHAADKPSRLDPLLTPSTAPVQSKSGIPSTWKNTGPECKVPGCTTGPNGGGFVAKSERGLYKHFSSAHGLDEDDPRRQEWVAQAVAEWKARRGESLADAPEPEPHVTPIEPQTVSA